MALVTLLSSCSWTSGDQYFIHWGPRIDVIVRERTSWDLVVVQELFFRNNQSFKDQMGGFTCNGRHSQVTADKCVMKLLHAQTEVSRGAQLFWSRATDSQASVMVDDFRGAFGTIRRSADGDRQFADCLTLSAYPHIDNWTTRMRSGSNCKAGKHVWE